MVIPEVVNLPGDASLPKNTKYALEVHYGGETFKNYLESK